MNENSPITYLSPSDLEIVRQGKRIIMLKTNIRERLLDYICPVCDTVIHYKDVMPFVKAVESERHCWPCIQREKYAVVQKERLDKLLHHKALK